jgi:hypothetical protein
VNVFRCWPSGNVLTDDWNSKNPSQDDQLELNLMTAALKD